MSRQDSAITLHDVARRAGVHFSTVSRALDPARQHRVKEETRDRIIEVAEEMGYRTHIVARGLKSGRTTTVGVVAADLGNTWVTPILHGLAGALERGRMLPFIAETQDDHDRFSQVLAHMKARQVDAIVVLAAREGDREILESTADDVPVIIAARPLMETVLPQVVNDDRQGGRMAAGHLHVLGHQRVAQLRGPNDVASFPYRAEGFSTYCAEHGLDEVDTGHLVARSPTMEQGALLMRQFLDLPGKIPGAVFAHNDLLAVGALNTLRSEGIRVPDEISLMGFNDTPMVAELTPALTTVRFESLQVGLHAGRMVLSILEGDAPTSDIVLQPSLVTRNSTGPVHADQQT